MLLFENIRIEKIGGGGVGIAKDADGKTIIIKGAVVPYTFVDCKVVKKRKDYIEAQLLSIKNFDNALTQAKIQCPHYIYAAMQGIDIDVTKKGCGGCRRQIVAYSKQLEIKKKSILDALRVLGETASGMSIADVIPASAQYGYRNKIEFSFGMYPSRSQETKELVFLSNRNLGFHKQGKFATVIDIDRCYLISKRMHSVFDVLKKILSASGLSVYNPKTHLGFLRHLVIREGVNTGQILVNLSVADQKLVDFQKPLWKKCLEDLKHDSFLQETITSFVIIVNNGLGDSIHTKETVMSPLWGDGVIHEKLYFDGGKTEITFRISPFSFFQTNTHGAEILYQIAKDLLGPCKGTLLDLYCGTGTVGMTLLKLGVGSRVLGIETVEDAVHDAHFNAKINRLEEQTTFLAGKAEELLRKNPLITEYIEALDAVILDPPRDGLHPSVIEFLGELRKKKSFTLLYISCNPVSFARDLGLLSKYGFSCSVIQPVDMFPQTHHIELVAKIG